MKTLAALLVELGKPVELTEIEIPALQPGQVLIEVLMTGICQTQVQEIRGMRGEDKFLPHCLGHEGCGKVKEIGPGVRKVKVGDTVVLSWMKGSGFDVPSTKYMWNGKTVNSGAITTFEQFSVISENRLTVLPPNFPLKEAALFGCAIPTGFGAVLNTARAQAGQSLAVFGTGGVGLFAVAAASITGCYPVIAVDVNPLKLKAAEEMGATHSVLVEGDGPVKKLQELVPGGLDFAIEASGQPVAMQQALECVHPRGGTAVVIGNARFGSKMEFSPRQLNDGKRLLGTWGGDNEPDIHFPRYFRLFQSGRLKLDVYTKNVYALSQINKALEDMEAGRVVRPLIDMKL